MSTATATPKGFSLDIDCGVLAVTLHWESVVSERILEELRECVVEHLPQASTAVLFDCRKLTGPATSQFLATLVAVRKSAMQSGLLVCVSNLSGPVREAYRVSRLDRIIPLYDDRAVAMRAVGDYSIGRTAVASVPQRSAALPSQEKLSESRGPGAASTLGGQASAAMASAAASWSGVRENWRATSQSLSPRQLAQLSGVVAALVLVVGLAWYLLSPSGTLAAAASTDDRPLAFGGDAKSLLVGKLEVRSGEFAYGDAGALVFAWRVGEGPQPKVLGKTIHRYLNQALASERFPHAWMHVGRASETGHFRVGISAPGEYDVLIVSGSSGRGSSLTTADEQALSQWFDAPRALIGKHPYRLLRQRIEQAEVTLNEVFARK